MTIFDHPATSGQADGVAAPLLAWSEELAIGIVKIDRQHRHLLEIINRLGTLRAQRADSSQLAAVLTELQRYTLYHFQTETALMQHPAISEEHRRAHLREHQRFVERIGQTARLATTDCVE